MPIEPLREALIGRDDRVQPHGETGIAFAGVALLPGCACKSGQTIPIESLGQLVASLSSLRHARRQDGGKACRQNPIPHTTLSLGAVAISRRARTIRLR